MAVQATAVWRVRPSGNNLNGGGYDPGIAGAATDYSQQNAAQAIGTNGTTTGAGATTFTDATAGAFTSAMVGNCIQIASGTNFQAGVYFVTAFTNANSVVLDRTPSSGGAGSAGVWKLGGGWADPFTNVTAALGFIVPGNIVYILGSGTPNPAAYTYDYTSNAFVSPVVGTLAAGFVRFANDPSTPGYKAPPDTTGGMPTIKINNGTSIWNAAAYNSFEGIWAVNATGSNLFLSNNGVRCKAIGCVQDHFGITTGTTSFTNGSDLTLLGCELFSSVSASGGIAAISGSSVYVIGCNIHDTPGPGASVSAGTIYLNNIIAKCAGDGLAIIDNGAGSPTLVCNNTIDGNTGHGISVATTRTLDFTQIYNNIISNQTGVGKFGLTILAGSTALNDLSKILCDYNVFYNNTANYNAISAGPHDTALGSNPYVAQSTENYTLA